MWKLQAWIHEQEDLRESTFRCCWTFAKTKNVCCLIILKYIVKFQRQDQTRRFYTWSIITDVQCTIHKRIQGRPILTELRRRITMTTITRIRITHAATPSAEGSSCAEEKWPMHAPSREPGAPESMFFILSKPFTNAIQQLISVILEVPIHSSI